MGLESLPAVPWVDLWLEPDLLLQNQQQLAKMLPKAKAADKIS